LIALLFAMLCAAGFTNALAAKAADQGIAMAQQRGAYVVRPWVLYQSADPLRAVHGQAGVDAVIVETPFERVRYEAYLDALQGTPPSRGTVVTMAREARKSLGFLVYAHSRTELDRTFLSRFRPARIALSNGETLADIDVVRFGPSQDFYDVGTFRESRWVGSITYRFVFAQCSAKGIVRFTDGYGRTYSLPFVLARFE
jgi:hypothetical protein